MSLANLCTRNFIPTTIQKGTHYFVANRVGTLDIDGTQLKTTVQGSRAKPYQVHLGWNPQGRKTHLFADCTCPHYEDGAFCKHIWATLLALDDSGKEILSTSNPIKMIHDDEDREENETLSEERFAPIPSLSTRFQRGSEKKGGKAWETQLKEIEEKWLRGEVRSNHSSLPTAREIWYLVNIEESRSRGSLVINLYQRARRTNGQLGKLKPLGITHQDIPLWSEERDRENLALLLGNQPESEYGYSYYYDHHKFAKSVLSPVMYEILLPKLSATERFGCLNHAYSEKESIQPLRWDPGPPWRFKMNVTENRERSHWEISGILQREGSEKIDLKEPLCLFSQGLALFPSTLARWDGGQAFPWAAQLREKGSIEIPTSAKKAFLKRLYQIPSIDWEQLPPELRLEPKQVGPQIHVIFRKNDSPYSHSGDLNIRATFDYDGHVATPSTSERSFVDLEKGCVYLRDLSTERSWLERLRDLGCKPPYYPDEKTDFTLPSTGFLRVASKLLELGCTVEAEGGKIRSPHHVDMEITSGIDWFNLSAEVDFEGIAIPLPKLLAALKRNERLIQLDDGTHGLVPAEWLKRYAPLVSLGKISGDHIEYTKPQATLLEALLEEEPHVRLDATFKEFVKKMHSFQGIQPVEPPADFRGELRTYQKEGLGWFHFLADFGLGGCLADDMGLGKTVQALSLFEERRTAFEKGLVPSRPSLVVVPKSLIHNWIEEASRFTPKLKVLNFTGSLREERLDELQKCHFVVTTYGILRKDILQLKKVSFDYVILDESQAIKNASSQTAKAARLLQGDHRLAMTGTPVENHIGELGSLFEFLNPGWLGFSSRFRELTSRRDLPSESLKSIAKGLRPFILRRTKQQVLRELPPKTEQTIYCEFDKDQRQLYDELKEYYRLQLTQKVKEMGLNRAKIHVLEALLRLRQAACHPGLLDPKRRNEPSAKLESLMEQLGEILEEGHKGLIFSQFVSLLSIVRDRLDQKKIPYEYLDGQTRNRKERIDRFQNNPNCPLFLISLKAGGLGLNLTAADYIFILDPWWNPAVEAQAIDRAHRIGQTRPVFAYRLIAEGTVEEKIVELQNKKRGLVEAILSESTSLLRNLTSEDLQFLLS
jgi:superfamily II DNA or RNA helicase